jgi:hypothetical protein
LSADHDLRVMITAKWRRPAHDHADLGGDQGSNL